MDKLDTIIKDYLEEKRRPMLGQRPVTGYPTTEDLYRFIAEDLRGEELRRMLDHLTRSAEDTELVRGARALLGKTQEAQRVEVPAELVRRAKALFPDKPKATGPGSRRYLWLGLAVAAFALSFVWPRYFFQCLVLTLLFGAKWIADERAAKTQVLIFKALRQDEEPSDSKDWHRTQGRL